MEDGFLHPPITLFQTLEESFELVSIKLIHLPFSTNGDDNPLLERLDVGEDSGHSVQTNNGVVTLVTNANSTAPAFSNSEESCRDELVEFNVGQWCGHSAFPHNLVFRGWPIKGHLVVNGLRLGAFSGELILHNYDV